MQSMETLQLQLFWLLQSVLQQEHRHHHFQTTHYVESIQEEPQTVNKPGEQTIEQVLHVPKIIPQWHVSPCTAENISDMPVPMTAEEVEQGPLADQQHRHLQAQTDHHVDAQVPMHDEERDQVPVLTQEHHHHHEQVEHHTDTRVPQEHEEFVHTSLDHHTETQVPLGEDFHDCRGPSYASIGTQVNQKGSWITEKMLKTSMETSGKAAGEILGESFK